MRVRGDILRTYQSVHTWTGIVAGLVLFIGFYAGSLTMFEEEITQWATPPSHHLPQVTIDKIDNLITKALDTSENAQQGFKINFNDASSPMTWYEKKGGRGLYLDNVMVHATLSAQGDLITRTEPTNELGDLIDMLHRTAGIAGKVGHENLGVLVLGVASILYFLALVSGVIFLLPTLVKTFFSVRKNKGANRFWLDSHNLVGVVSLPFHLIIAWSVVVFAFHDVLYDGLDLVYGKQPIFEQAKSAPVNYSASQLPPISTYIDKVNELTEGYSIKYIEFSRLSTQRPSVAISVMNTAEMMRNNTGDFIYMNPYTLAPAFSSISMSEDDYYVSYVASFFSLHFGGFGGELGRWLYFVMGLLGAFLFYSGNLLWLEKRRQKKPIHSKSNRFMANLTIGVCLGSILAVVVTLLASKWLYLINAKINNSYVTCYYLVFFAVLIYSFVFGAAKSAIHMQKIIALTCLCIPITTLVAITTPIFSQWNLNAYSNSAIDISALIFAAIFYYGALKTKKRAYFGERNSIWAL
ncbi:PepSY-associated TM helix domain-containing protein [Colwellia sp. 4_MG-2023]|uniref:PepSY-associated TM helix domain-containing protein n=1 Tax=unclassified Colwellia TaxID=196834 RepID=UPI0026E26177|nr:MULTISPECIES: PepSY-associated TM helix domain-containing protein [unclassified Colwellia]MDO6507884.1 PepSY-associated TM helix domain-containing protein [Colwellia sp. 5_MG-2023]MDO6556563.1 PepSY-associated TM helix domain-containing protein [Colwellia sp. 4_MG-2023]